MTTPAATAAPPFPPGLPREASGDRPLALVEGRVWIVRSGRVDVFATRMKGGEPDGARTHLFRVEAGGPVFGVTGAEAAGDGLALIAVGSTGTELGEVALEEVRALAAAEGTRRAAAETLSAWVEHLHRGVGGARQRKVRSLAPGEEAAVEAGAIVQADGRVAWAQALEGKSLLMGRADAAVEPGETLPLARGAWLEAATAGRLVMRTTEEVLADPASREAAWRAVERMHALLLAATEERIAAAHEAERRRQALRAREAGSIMNASLAQLAATLEPSGPRGPAMRLRAPGDASREDHLFAAFRLVAGAMGIPLDQVVPPDAGLRIDPLDALAQASRVRIRRVVLNPGWWESDVGPLLGTLAEGKRPVAILPTARGGYEIFDPAARTTVAVTPESAATLGPFASALYRSFPAERLTPWAVLRFGLHESRADLATILLAATTMAALGLITPMATGLLFDAIIPSAEPGQMVQLTAVLLICAVATSIFQVVRGLALLRLETRMGTSVQAAVWDRLLALPIPFFRDYSAGDLAVRAMGVEEIRRTLSGAALAGLLSGLFSLANFALLVYYDAWLAATASVLVATALAASAGISWMQLRSQREIVRIRAKASGMVLQLLAGIAKVKMVGAEVQAFGVWARLFSEQRIRRYRTRTLGNRLAVFNAAFPLLCTVVLFWSMMRRGEGEDAMSTGQFLAFLAAFNLCLAGALAASKALIDSLLVIPLYEQVKPILETLPEVAPGRNHPGELSGAVELQHVHFRYTEDGPPILRGVSVRIRPGEFVAFVGPSGSGKSTLFRLLLGFETPESGGVYYDEQDIFGLDIQAVRRQIGVVLQAGKLMPGDIFTNIVGSSLATMDDAWEAARMAGLDEDIRQMPMGMHTMLSEGGGTLSGGQRQRLLIARAVVHRPRILLFDEATSALDNRTQAIVSRSLEQLQATRVVIAHRLSTIVNADRIYVVVAGSIVESGTYSELLEKGGVFAEMAKRQLA